MVEYGFLARHDLLVEELVLEYFCCLLLPLLVELPSTFYFCSYFLKWCMDCCILQYVLYVMGINIWNLYSSVELYSSYWFVDCLLHFSTFSRASQFN